MAFPTSPRSVSRPPGDSCLSRLPATGRAAPPSIRSGLPLRGSPSCSLCSYGEQSPSQAGSPSPGSPRLSFAPQTSNVFQGQSSGPKENKKIPVPAFPRSPSPCLAASLDPSPGSEAGAAGGQGCSSPGFSPGPSCSRGCLEILESFLAGGRASRRDPGRPLLDPCGPQPAHLGPGRPWGARPLHAPRDRASSLSAPALPA